MSGSIVRRGLARLSRTSLTRQLKRLRVRASPIGRAEAGQTQLPFRYRDFRIATIGPAGPPIDRLAVRDALGDGEPPSLPYDLAVMGGSTELTPETLDALIECERRSTRTVLIATEPEHLETELATVSTDIAVIDHGIREAAVARVGVERVHQLPDDPDDVRGWLRTLVSLR